MKLIAVFILFTKPKFFLQITYIHHFRTLISQTDTDLHIFIYNGQLDLIVPTSGKEATLNNM